MSAARVLLARAALAGAAICALAAYARAWDAQWALVAIVPIVVAVRRRFTTVPRPLRAPLRWVVVPAIVLAGTLAWLSLLHAGPPGALERAATRAVGAALAIGIAALSLGARAYAPGRALAPAVIALLALAGIERGAPLDTYGAAAAACAFVHLLAEPGRGTVAPRRLPLRLGRAAALAIFALATGATALGIMRLLPLAQGRLERALLDAELPGSGGSGAAGLAGGDVRVGSLGRLELGEEIALRVFAARADKLRAHAYLRFDGRTWRAPSQRRAPPAPGAPPAPALAAALDSPAGELFALDAAAPRALEVSQIVLETPADGALPIPPAAAWLRVDAAEVELDPAGVVTVAGGARVTAYAVAHATGGGAAPATTLDASARAAALDTPAELDPRVARLAAGLAARAKTPRARVVATVEAVRGLARYSLDPGRFHGRDPVAEFLFEKHRGWCEHFASATALLLRLQGIPARYVTGYAVHEGARAGDHYVVRARDAHAWVEAWVEAADDGEGAARGRWIEVDATPSSALAEAAGARGEGFGLGERLAGLLARLQLHGARALGRGAWLTAAAIAAALLALGLARGVAWLHARRGGPARARREASGPAREAPLPTDIRRLVDELEAHWTRRGKPRPRWRTLREHLEAVAPAPLDADHARAARLVERVYQAAYDARADEAPRVSSRASWPPRP